MKFKDEVFRALSEKYDAMYARKWVSTTEYLGEIVSGVFEGCFLAREKGMFILYEMANNGVRRIGRFSSEQTAISFHRKK